MEMLENMVTLNKKVVARVLEKEEKVLKSGLILTGEAVNQAMEDFRRAEVISSDFDRVQPGEVVIYLRFVGSPAGEYVILDAGDILGKEGKNQ